MTDFGTEFDPAFDPLALIEGWSPELLMAEAERLSAAVQTLPRQIDAVESRGEAGNGSVSAVVGGQGELRSVRISRQALRYNDPARLAELLVAAIGRAEQAAELAREDVFGQLRFLGRPLAEFNPLRSA